MSLRDEWLADPEPGTFAEWLRRRTVPPTLLVLQTPEVNRQEREKVERKPRKSRAKAGGKQPVHGSTHGRKRHLAAGEEVCAECVAGHEAEKERRAANKREWRRQQGAQRRQAKCGTPYMARKHRERGEEVDEACKQSERDEWHKRNPPKEKAA